MGNLCGKIICEQLAQVMILQAFLIEREEMHAVFLLHHRQGGLRRSREDDHCRDVSGHQPLKCFIVVVVRALHGDIESIENAVGGHFGLAVLQVEVDVLALQIVIGLDFVSRENMKLGIVELRDVLNALLDIGIQHRILLLQESKIVLVDDSHVHVLEKQHVIQVLKSADPKNRQNAHPVGPQIVHDVPDVLSEPGART